ncbi:MAG: acyltransferase [Phycisphaerae bacterium]
MRRLTSWIRCALIRFVNASDGPGHWDHARANANICIHETARVAPTARLYSNGGGTIRIGENVEICDGVILATYGGTIDLGANVFVGPYSVIYGHGGLTIGRDTMVAAHTVIIPANHVFADNTHAIRGQGETRMGIEIEEDVWVGAGARILDGTRISRGSVIGAGSVVRDSVPANSVVVGVPARVVRTRE